MKLFKSVVFIAVVSVLAVAGLKVVNAQIGPGPQAPIITSITPTQGTGGTTVTISGKSLASATGVYFYNNISNQLVMGIPQQNIFVSSAGSSLSFTIDNVANGMLSAGTYQVEVVNPGGASNGVSFSFTPTNLNAQIGPGPQAPIITSITPTQGTGGTTVTISGKSLASATGVYFYNNISNQLVMGIPQQNIFVSSAGSSLSFTIDNVANGMLSAGTYQVEVVNPGGASNGVSFSFTPTNLNAPTITSINPTSGSVGSSVTIYGSGFTASNNTIEFNGYTAAGSVSAIEPPCALPAKTSPTQSFCPQQLIFTVPSIMHPYCASGQACSQLAMSVRPGTYQVTVMNANGTSNQAPFTVIGPNSTDTTPSIAITYPSGGEILDNGGKSNIATIRWSTQNFGNLNVEIDLQNANNYYPVKQIAPNVPNTGSYLWPSDPTLASGSYKIDISSEDKGPSASAVSGPFSIVTDVTPIPQTTFSQPIAGDGYTANFPLPVYWTQNYASNFTVVSLFKAGLPQEHAVFTSPSMAAVAQGNMYEIPATAVTNAGQYYIAICDRSGPSTANSSCVQSATFSVAAASGNASVPTITSINPSSGNSGSTAIITGSGFTSADNTIEFNGYVAAGSMSATELSCALPAGGGTNGSAQPFCPQQLIFTVPSALRPYCAPGRACSQLVMSVQPGTYQVTVMNANGTSNQVPFTVTSSSSTPPIICPAWGCGPTPPICPIVGAAGSVSVSGCNPGAPITVQTLQQELSQLIALLLQLLQQAAAKGLLNSSQLNSVINSISH